MTAGAERPRAASRDSETGSTPGGRLVAGRRAHGPQRRERARDGRQHHGEQPTRDQDQRVDRHAGVELRPPRDRSRQRHQGRERNCAEHAEQPAGDGHRQDAQEGGDAHPARREPESSQRPVVPCLEHDLAAERLADEEQAGDGDRGREGLEAARVQARAAVHAVEGPVELEEPGVVDGVAAGRLRDGGQDLTRLRPVLEVEPDERREPGDVGLTTGVPERGGEVDVLVDDVVVRDELALLRIAQVGRAADDADHLGLDREPSGPGVGPGGQLLEGEQAQVHRRADLEPRVARELLVDEQLVGAGLVGGPTGHQVEPAGLGEPARLAPDPPLHDHRAVRDGRARQLDDRVGEPGGALHAVHRGHRRLLGGEVADRLRSERREGHVPLGPRVRGDEVVDDPVGPAGSGQCREDDGDDDREEDDHERARAPVAPQVRRRDQRCRSHREIIGRHRASRQPGDHVVEPSCYHPGGRPGYGAAVFSQTETCDRQSPVKGSRFHPPQRSRRVIPASRAIRSSSPGHTYRKGSEKISSSPSTTR